MRIIYLHGFASSPRSSKAQYFTEKIPDLIIPDLNQNDFGHLTVSRQIEQIKLLLTEPSHLIGSSLGGLTAAILAEQYPDLVQKIVLLAPAFNFTQYWRKRLGETTIEKWEAEKYLPTFHYSYEREIPLHYDFFRDAEQYSDRQFMNTVPTLILHGINDDVIPIEASEKYAKDKAWVKLISLDSDHSLGDYLETLFLETQSFFEQPATTEN